MESLLNKEDLNLKQLLIEKETQDEIIEIFGFKHPVEAIECGMLILSSFVKAKKQNCSMMYFYKENSGKGEYYKFDYLKLIEFIKTRPNDTCLHTVKLNKF